MSFGCDFNLIDNLGDIARQEVNRLRCCANCDNFFASGGFVCSIPSIEWACSLKSIDARPQDPRDMCDKWKDR